MLAQVDALWETSEPSAKPDLTSETLRRLRGFMLAGIAFRDAALEEVVAELRRTMNEFGSEDLDAGTRIAIEGTPSGSVTFRYDRPVSLWAVLQLAATQAGMRIENGSDGTITLKADAESEGAPDGSSRGLATRILPVGHIIDVDRAGTHLDAEELLDRIGVVLPAGGYARLEGEGEYLLVHTDVRAAAIIDAFSQLTLETHQQVYIATKVFTLRSDDPAADQLLGEEDATLVTEAIAGEADSRSIAAPTVVTRAGQPASIDLARMVPVAPSDGSPVTVIPIGLSMTVDPQPLGEQRVAIDGVIDITGLDPDGIGGDAPPSSLVPIPASRLDGRSTEFSAVLEPGQSAVIVAYDRPTDGQKVIVTLSAMRITPAGEPIRTGSGLE